MKEVFDKCDSKWRGLGPIERSGLKLKSDFARFDALLKFDLKIEDVPLPQGCKCGEVLMGKITPKECPLFSKQCRPDAPIGPCMVSSEGSCAACYKYDYRVM
jgi:hydrogenase expression/formation protein HypD